MSIPIPNENEALKAENTKVKTHISTWQERSQTSNRSKGCRYWKSQYPISLKKRGHYNNTLWEKYKILVLQWNDLTKQPEIIEAVKRVEDRNKQEAEAKREVQARQDKYQDALDRFISEGNEQLKAFSQSSRIDFDEKEAKAIYYGYFHKIQHCASLSTRSKVCCWKISREHGLEWLWQLSKRMCRTLDKTLCYRWGCL